MDPQVRLLLETTFEAFQTGMNLTSWPSTALLRQWPPPTLT